MILSRINYYENRGREDYWEIKDVDFNMYNLIVGLNATGKTRLINVISGLVKLIRRKSQYTNGYWQVDFKKNSEENYRYKLELSDGKVIQEEIEVAGEVVLKREGERGKIYSYTKDEMIDINPPADELTFHVRRDVKEYPFLEEILNWAANFRGYQFSAVNPYQVAVPSDSDALLESLNTTPYLLVEALKEKDITEAIIEDFSLIGYPIDDVSVHSQKIQGRASEFPVSFVREKDLACKTSQMKMSQGMYRAFSLIVIMEYLLRLNRECTVVIDDLGEGLDYERSTKITELLFEKIKEARLQLIVTSNDRFLINAVDIKYLNLLERSAHVVTSYNYNNSKEKFEEFEFAGLNNFDFFAGKMYREWGND